MKYLITLAILISCFTAKATHLLGGEITWECTPSGQYVFNVVLYKECGVNTASLPNVLSVLGPQGTITCNKVGTALDISPNCLGSNIACLASPSGTGAVLRQKYQSTPISLTGTPPSRGWEFSWNNCCRPSTVRNLLRNGDPFHLRSIMYSNVSGLCNDESPVFVQNATYLMSGDSATFSSGAISHPSDSVYFDFAQPMEDSSTSIIFAAGFSYTQPFPNNGSMSANGVTTINHETGVIKTNIANGVSGSYAYCVELQQWRSGVLLSKIYRDCAAVFIPDTPQIAPAFSVTNSNHTFTNSDRETFQFELYEGDTLNFDLESVTTQMRPDTTLAAIVVSARGFALDTPFAGPSTYLEKASLYPIAPQSGYTSVGTNKVRFNWKLGSEHVTSGKVKHIFNIKLQNDICPFPARSNVAVLVSVNPTVWTDNDTLNVCTGDSILLRGSTRSGNFQWTSADATFSSQLASPSFASGSSQYYYLTDPQYPGFMDSVYVNADTIAPISFVFNGTQIVFNDPNNTPNPTWYYNGVPFTYSYDTLTPFGLGSYQVSITNGNCSLSSPVINLTSNNSSLAVVSTGNGNYLNGPASITGSIGVSFTMNQALTLQSVSVPGLMNLNGKTGGYDLTLKIYDQQEAEIHSQQVTLGNPFPELFHLSTNVPLVANEIYTIALTGDTGYAFSVFEKFNLPATPYNVGFTVLEAKKGGALIFPDSSSNYLLPLGLGVDQWKWVGLEGNLRSGLRIFPNPAKDQLEIAGLTHEAEKVELVNVNGQVIRSMVITATTKPLILNCTNVPPGVYMVRVYLSKGAAISGKLLIE